MAWSGGTYTKGNNSTGGWAGDAAAGVGIEAGRHDTQDNDFATGINQCLNKDGSNAATGNLNIGNFKLTAVANGTASTDATNYGQVEAGINKQSTTLSITNTRFSADATGPVFALQKSRGASVGTNTIVQSGDTVGALNFNGANGTSYTNAAQISAVVDGTPGASNDMPGALAFSTTPDASGTLSERMRIKNDGKVGIGLTAPSSIFSVGSTATVARFEQYSADATSANVDMFKSRNATVGSHTIVQSGDATGAMQFWGSNGSSYERTAAISSNVDGTPGASSDMPGRLVFWTTPDGGTLTERMRITNAGTFLINTTANFSSDYLCLNFSTPTYNGLAIRDSADGSGAYYQVYRNSANGLIGSVQRVTTTNAVNFNTTSDYRLKEQFAPIQNALQAVLNLKPCTFVWKDCKISATGFVAHELQEIFPDAVCGVKDEIDPQGNILPQGVDYGRITPLLTAAIQELNAKLEALQAQVDAL